MKLPRPNLSGGLAALVALGSLIVVAVVPDMLVSAPPGTLDLPYLAPSPGHFLGTDGIGQDLFTELLYATRISLGVALLASLVATGMGVVIGLAAGYRRGRWDAWLMHLTDTFLLLPSLPLIILLAAYLNSGLAGIALVIGLTAWPSTARVVRANVRQVCQCNFIRSAEAMGSGNFAIMFRHILPNIYPLVMAKATLAAASAMVAEAGVSFLGLGGTSYRSWGAMLHEAFANGGLLNGCYWWYLPPIVCISATVLCLTLAGQSLLDSNETGVCVRPAPKPARGGFHRGLLQVVDLSVDFIKPDRSLLRAVDHLSLTIMENDQMAIIGQTGSGKSILLLALLGLLPPNAKMTGHMHWRELDLATIPEKTFQKLRGREIAYVPQATGTSLNPLLTVGYQVAEQARVHHRISRKAAMDKAVQLLSQTGIPAAGRRSREYPHCYSGGMIQRALVAMGLAAEAPLLLLDEPTKGLDPENREALLGILKGRHGATTVAVTHDLAFAERFADKVVVMLESRVVEVCAVQDFFRGPLHPYSAALLMAQPCNGFQVPVSDRNISAQAEGCPFAGRCGESSLKCQGLPPLVDVGSRQVRCWRYVA